jgi:pimeloyl-ACP methyl ester carboxylesterase
MIRIESLLAARLFLAPQLVGDRLYFISNLGGKLSLYAMDATGSIPEPLLPPHVALQNPELIGGYSFYVFPDLGQILVMVDQDGDEHYQPTLIPLEGGYPEPAFGDFFRHFRVSCTECDATTGTIYLTAQSQLAQIVQVYRGQLADRSLTKMDETIYGSAVTAVTPDHRCAALVEGYSVGDSILYLWHEQTGSQLLYGTPIGGRKPEQKVPLSGFSSARFSPSNAALLIVTALFDDAYSLGYIHFEQPQHIAPITITGVQHSGVGELEAIDNLHANRYSLRYNIDGCSWLYEGSFDETTLTLALDQVICGQAPLSNGVLEASYYDADGDRYALAFSTATSPTQLYLVNPERSHPQRATRERVLGIPEADLARGEDASFTSFDGRRISARLYMPADNLGYHGPRPLVYYIHGGPQGQERPNFAWFSMPLIQFLTLNGFAVFVPNARGSTGYGLGYTKLVDLDWGGDDRLDHVHAMGLLHNDQRIDARRAGVVGRSYGGYMTLTLAGRHPELWSAAVDMFGPYDLLTFMERIPETWKPYFRLAVGDPTTVAGHAQLVERSPRTYINQLACPLLVIQGKNDPRVIERESRDVVDQLRTLGKEVEYLMFENEGHDVLKYENRVTCYNAITDFFRKQLTP